jgi:hypothetical protein
MKNQTFTLKTFMQTLAEAAAHADKMLRQDYAARIREPENKGTILISQPLCVTNMRVSFTANVTDKKNSSDLYLDFNNPNGNFKGEIVFKPSANQNDTDFTAEINKEDDLLLKEKQKAHSTV